MWSEKIRPNYESDMYPEVLSGFSRAREDPNYVFFMSPYYVDNNERFSMMGYPCHFTDVGPSYGDLHVAFGMAKDSPLRNLFSHHVGRLRENGVIDNIFRRHKSQQDDSCCQTSNDGEEGKISGTAIGLNMVFGIFMVLVVGAGLGLVWKTTTGSPGVDPAPDREQAYFGSMCSG